MKTSKCIFYVAIVATLFTYCKKDGQTGSVNPAPTPYYISLTDAPGPYTAVNVNIQNIEITGNGNAVMLNTTPGIYNLLNFTNGADTLIATGSLNIDKVQQIRLILGPNNSVAVGGTVYPLAIPSGAESGLKLQVHHDLQAGVAYYVLLDFDANKSIVQEGNGSYQLKPVIRTIETALSGAIKGKLSVAGVSAVITAATGTNSYSTGPDLNGDFIIKGLPAGTYSLSVTPAAPYSSSTMTNVTVSTGVTTNVGAINI
jgi:hypothetical protein